MKKILLLILSLAILFFSTTSAAFADEKYPVRIFVFHLETCPHCKQELEFLHELKKQYPNMEIRDFEVSGDFKNRNIFQRVMEHYQLSGSVPTNIIGDEAIVGFDNENGIGKELEKKIKQCSDQACPSWIDEMLGLEPLKKNIQVNGQSDDKPDSYDNQDGNNKESSIRLFGKRVSFDKETSTFSLALVLGLADGINPCMFSVLLFLLTYLLAIGSKRKAIKAGLAFIVTTFFVYLLFMYGLIKIIEVLQITGLIRKLVIAFALFAGVLMIKDYFAYGKGISLEIPERFKPMMEKLVKKGTVASAVLLAMLSSIVELPCTSGIPLAYISILASKGLAYFWYLVLYNIFFVLPLIVIVFGVIFAWSQVDRVEAWREKSKKYMRLVAGVLLLFLAFALWKNIL